METDELRRWEIARNAAYRCYDLVARSVSDGETYPHDEMRLDAAGLAALKVELAAKGLTVVDDGYGCWLFLTARICAMCLEIVPLEPPCPACVGREVGAQGRDFGACWEPGNDHHGHGEDEMQERLVAAGAGL